MFVLITYAVNVSSPSGARRLRKVAKACLNYGKRVQNSVFECILTEAQYVSLKVQLESLVDKDQDSVRFYSLGSNWKHKVETLSSKSDCDFTDELII